VGASERTDEGVASTTLIGKDIKHHGIADEILNQLPRRFSHCNNMIAKEQRDTQDYYIISTMCIILYCADN